MRLTTSYVVVSILVVIAAGFAITHSQDKAVPVAFAKDKAEVTPASNGGLASIKILKHNADSEVSESTLKGGRKSTFNIDLELGESIENQIIALQQFEGDSREFRVEQQFETSMAIGDEGPHIDLINWKHYTSDWKPIESLGDNKFLTSKISEADTQQFPHVTSQEIHRIVLKEGGKRWGDLARKCKTPFDAPCYVGVSRISFRISANENGVWNEIHRINFSVPLGC